MSIYLIRHGETEGNAERRLQLPDIPLNQTGLEQAARLGDRLQDAGIQRVLTSDLTRAQQTAEAVAASTGNQVELEPLLQERSFGDHRGMLYSEIGPELFTEAYKPLNGETTEDFRRRVHRAWDRVTSSVDGMAGHLAVVTHGLVYRELLASCLDLPRDADGEPVEPPMPRNTALTVIEARRPWKVTLLVCAAHLEQSFRAI
jgi:probable phosphoglycerate mutase